MVLHPCKNLVPPIDVTLSDLILVDDVRMLPAGQEAAEAFYRTTDAPTPQSAVTSKIQPSGFDTIMPKILATATVDRLVNHAPPRPDQWRIAST
jgi:hypothetical protein